MPNRGGVDFTAAPLVDGAPGFGANVQSGHYYYLNCQNTKQATAMVDGSARLVPIAIHKALIVDRLFVDCTTLAASSNVKLLIYGSDAYGGTPVTNLYASAAISTATTGIKEASSVATTLQPGVYWFGALPYGGTPSLSCSVVPAGPMVPIDMGTSAPATTDNGPLCHQTTGLTTGVVPGTWAGAIATSAPPRLGIKIG